MFKIMGCYMGITSVVDEFNTLKETQKMLLEYRITFGRNWSLWIQHPSEK